MTAATIVYHNIIESDKTLLNNEINTLDRKGYIIKMDGDQFFSDTD